MSKPLRLLITKAVIVNYVGKNITLLIIIGVLLFVLFNLFQNQGGRGQMQEVAYSELLTDAGNGSVKDVTIKGDQILGHMSDGHAFMTYTPRNADVATRLIEKGVQVKAAPDDSGNPSIFLAASRTMSRPITM